MAKVVIFVEDTYEDQEVWYPYLRLKEAGHTPMIVGKQKREYMSKHRYPIKAGNVFRDISLKSYAGIIIPGGYAPDKLRQYPEALKLVRQFDEKGKLIAAICHAAWVLVSAGVVKGRKMTCYRAIKDDVINAGAKYVDAKVVVDKNMITSRIPPDLPAFMREVLAFLQ